MGRGMAANLMNKTFAGVEGVYDPKKQKPAFVVYDAFQPAVDSFLNEHTRAYAGRDVIPASSPAGVARLAATVITSLPSSPQVEEVYLGEGGLAEALEELDEQRRAESLFIDCTTLEQSVAKEVASKIGALGGAMVDSPMSGGEKLGFGEKLSALTGSSACRYRRSAEWNLVVHGRRSRSGVSAHFRLSAPDVAHSLSSRAASRGQRSTSTSWESVLSTAVILGTDCEPVVSLRRLRRDR
jgi:3-hydroxyisobutyrate dehydrogenase